MSGLYSETLKNYCTVTDLQNYLMITIDSSFHTQIETWIAAAEKEIDNFLGYTTASGIMSEAITGETARSYIDSDSNLMVFPQKIPIISVSSLQLVKGSDSITISLTTDAGDNRYTIPSTADYILYPDDELSITGASVISSFADVRYTKFFSKMNYIAGYTAVPSDLRMATVDLVSNFIMRHANKEGLRSITQGRISKTFMAKAGQSDFVTDAYARLKPYKIAHQWLM